MRWARDLPTLFGVLAVIGSYTMSLVPTKRGCESRLKDCSRGNRDDGSRCPGIRSNEGDIGFERHS